MKTSFLSVLIAALLVGAAFGQNYQIENFDVYKYSTDGSRVPDVDKVPLPPNPGDNSCWQATAANLLGAAGYGVGPDAQARATNIYNQITGALGKNNLGQCDRAINWWLYNFGKNPNAGQNFAPNNPYTDVTAVTRPLMLGGAGSDYNFLLNELQRCQYVGVGFYFPEHCMTLVGGNYWNNPNGRPDGNKSIWHDSDRDQPDTVGGDVNDDVYINAMDAGGRWILQDYPTMYANYYTTLCPGLNKPEAAVRNYDAAYFVQALDPDRVLNDPAFRVAGIKADLYGTPVWYDETTVRIFNEELPEMKKEVYLLVDYYDRVADRQENILLQAMDPQGVIQTLTPTSVTTSADNGQLLFTWLLDWQPPWENIIFPDGRYKNLMAGGNVKDWNVATICIPEPGTFVLLVLAGLGLGWYARRRR